MSGFAKMGEQYKFMEKQKVFQELSLMLHIFNHCFNA